MPDQIKLQCRPELLQQWQDDVAKNPAAFTSLLALSPEFVVMLVNDAIAAGWLQARLTEVTERALAAEFRRGCGGACDEVTASRAVACRLCHPVTETVGWRCTGQCGQREGGAR